MRTLVRWTTMWLCVCVRNSTKSITAWRNFRDEKSEIMDLVRAHIFHIISTAWLNHRHLMTLPAIVLHWCWHLCRLTGNSFFFVKRKSLCKIKKKTQTFHSTRRQLFINFNLCACVCHISDGNADKLPFGLNYSSCLEQASYHMYTVPTGAYLNHLHIIIVSVLSNPFYRYGFDCEEH